jgi:hypothetical protein
MHDDWHWDRVMAAIRSAAEATGEPAVSDALTAATAKTEVEERVAARNRKQEETEATHRQEEEAVMAGLQVDLQALRSTALVTLLTAVEYVTWLRVEARGGSNRSPKCRCRSLLTPERTQNFCRSGLRQLRASGPWYPGL